MSKKAEFDLSTLRRKARDAFNSPAMVSDGPDGMVFLQSQQMQDFMDAVSPQVVLALLDKAKLAEVAETMNPVLADGTTLLDRYAIAAVAGNLAAVGQSGWLINDKRVSKGAEFMALSLDMAAHALVERQKKLKAISNNALSGYGVDGGDEKDDDEL